MTLYIQAVSIFPEIFESFLKTSLVAKALERSLLKIDLINPRDLASPPHFQVDDTPYGGGPGMVMKAEPLVKAVETAKSLRPHAHVVLMSASGSLFTQKKAAELRQRNDLVLVCGRYEGVDQRVIDLTVNEELSVGDYVLMGGEVPAMVVIEACARLVENVLGNNASTTCESFARQTGSLLEAPQYTRPLEFRGLRVPDVLRSGDHKQILNWRREQSLAKTKATRPELLSKATPHMD